MLLMWTSTGVKPGGGDGAVCPYVGTPDSKILVNVAWAVDGIIRCGIVEKPENGSRRQVLGGNSPEATVMFNNNKKPFFPL